MLSEIHSRDSTAFLLSSHIDELFDSTVIILKYTRPFDNPKIQRYSGSEMKMHNLMNYFGVQL